MYRGTLSLSFVALPLLCAAAFASSERGQDGLLSISMWQEATTFNAYASPGTKDIAVAGLMSEPLASLDPTGALEPRLAEYIPSTENGGISADRRSMTWRLRSGLLWSDGSAMTADDVRFTWAYCMNEAIECVRRNRFANVADIEVVDPLTLTIHFKEPEFRPFSIFAEYSLPILQQAQFARCLSDGVDCTAHNLAPVGTGPFKLAEHVPGQHIHLVANQNYRVRDQPKFAEVMIYPSQAAYDSALAALADGTVDFAENLQVDPGVLRNFETSNKGRISYSFAARIERLHFNFSDPDPALGKARSTIAHPNPVLSDPAVRRALTMALDRPMAVDVGYGWSGRLTCNLIQLPPQYVSPNNEGCERQDIEGARAVLEAAGWVDRDGDGIREKDGRALRLTFQTSTNSIRNEFQQLSKAWWADIGVDVDLIDIPARIFFGRDITEDGIFQKFYADIQLYQTPFNPIYPIETFRYYLCGDIPSPDTNWVGDNIARYCDPEFDALFAQLMSTDDTQHKRDLIVRMNDMLIQDHIVVPLVSRSSVSGHSLGLAGVEVNSFDSTFWGIERWERVNTP